MTLPLPTRQGAVTSTGGKTWYAVFGAETGTRPPIVVVPGGPGMPHDYLSDFSELGTDRQVIFYDQIGTGRSSPIGAEAATTVSLRSMVAELDAVLAFVTGEAGYILLAHSAGGCVALEHAIRKPRGLKSLVLANTFPSGVMMQAGLRLCRDGLEPFSRAALSAGPAENPRFNDALGEFFAKHVCRVPPPDHLLRTLEASNAHPQIQHKLMGTNLFDWDGPLSQWTVIDQLHRVQAPTLAYSGAWDETGPECLRTLSAGIPRCEATIFDLSSHLPHIEQTSACLGRISSFIHRHC